MTQHCWTFTEKLGASSRRPVHKHSFKSHNFRTIREDGKLRNLTGSYKTYRSLWRILKLSNNLSSQVKRSKENIFNSAKSCHNIKRF